MGKYEKVWNDLRDYSLQYYTNETRPSIILNVLDSFGELVERATVTTDEIVKELNRETPNLEWSYDDKTECFWGEYKNGNPDLYEISTATFDHMPRIKTAHKITTFFMNRSDE